MVDMRVVQWVHHGLACHRKLAMQAFFPSLKVDTAPTDGIVRPCWSPPPSVKTYLHLEAESKVRHLGNKGKGGEVVTGASRPLPRCRWSYCLEQDVVRLEVPVHNLPMTGAAVKEEGMALKPEAGYSWQPHNT